MLSELIIYIIVFFHYYFKTTLPYKWNFCGLEFESSSKLLINYGSYCIVYAAFIYWFVQYGLRLMRNFYQWHLHGKGRFLAYMILISAATQVFWRLFLLATYFFTGHFYPWCTASTVIFLNFPSVLIVLTSIGNGLQLVFQGFVEFVKLFNFETVTRGHSSSEQSAGRSQIRLLDARIFDGTEAQPIVSGYSGESTDHSEYSFVIRPPGTRIHERSQASSEATVSSEYFSDIRILSTPDANRYDGTEALLPLSRSSEHRELRLLTETVTLVQKQVTPRQQESIPSISAIYYPYPSQRPHSKDETPGVSTLSSISKLGQLAPKQKKEIRAEELDEGEKVSKRKVTTDGKIRSTRKEKNQIGVSESTAGIHRENDQNFLHRTRSGLIYGPLKR